jgi:PAS domain S-box-containing protein
MASPAGRDAILPEMAELGRQERLASQAQPPWPEPAPDASQSVLAAITDPFSVVDASWRFVFANDACARQFGLSVGEILGRTLWELEPRADGSAFAAELARAMRDRVTVTVDDHDIEHGRWLEVRAYPIGEASLALYSRDVSARRGEEELARRFASYGELRAEVGVALAQERELRPMLQRACEAVVARLGMAFARIWLTDEAGEFLELQASAGLYTHIDGPHRRVPVGALKIGLIAAERTPTLTNDLEQDPRIGDREWAEREGMRAFAGYPLVFADKVIGVVAAFSRQPLPEDAMVALGAVGDAVAQGVTRRRAELSLEARAAELARSNSDLEQFAYVASHDLQEPLRMVASYTQLLARRYRGQLDQDADDFIGFAVEGVTRMQRLINDLLAYSRVGKRAEAKPVELEHVFATARANLEAAIADSGAVITHNELPVVHFDEVQLLQVLQNLIGNAIKFRGAEPPRIHLEVRRAGREWIVSVADNGIGIEPQYFERIFVIFQRLNAREQYPGTGIGLAITKKIIERHGGRIWVESRPGKGTTISFSIPVQPGRLRRNV